MPTSDQALDALAAALRRAREKCHLTVEEVAAASGISLVNLAAYEAGKAEATLLEVCAVAKAVGTTAQTIFADAEL